MIAPVTMIRNAVSCTHRRSNPQSDTLLARLIRHRAPERLASVV